MKFGDIHTLQALADQYADLKRRFEGMRDGFLELRITVGSDVLDAGTTRVVRAQLLTAIEEQLTTIGNRLFQAGITDIPTLSKKA